MSYFLFLDESGHDHKTMPYEVHDEFSKQIGALQFKGQGYKDGTVFSRYGIVYVPNPYGSTPEK